MSPWWLRPSPDAASDDEAENESHPEKTSQPARRPAPPSQEAPKPERPERPERPQQSAAVPAPERPRREAQPAEHDDEEDDDHDDNGHDDDNGDDHEDHDDDGDDDGEAEKATGGRSTGRRRGRRGRGSRGGRGRSDSSRGEGSDRDSQDDSAESGEGSRRHSFDADDLLFELATASEMIGPERSSSVADEAKIALFCDLENVALGVRDSKEVKKFDINLVLERLLEKGKIIVKKAYCDWERYSEFKRPFHEAAIEMIEIPQKHYSGKNSADIKMVVDAMDLSYSKEHLDTFVILSGDSDFSPLVSKLKENNKRVIGVGVKGASSKLLIGNCDEFIYYEDVWRSRRLAPTVEGLSTKTAEAFALMVDAIQALVRENKTVLWGSMIKQTMQRKNPSFNEGYYGYGSFSELLEDAAKKKLIQIKMDKRAGSYIVTGFAKK